MRTLAILGAASLTLTALGATSTSASSAPAIPLNGDQEVPAADADGHGFFTYEINGTEFCYTLEWQRIDTAFAAHIHRAPRGVNGGIVIPLSVGDGSGSGVDTCTTTTPELAAEIEANPKDFYVNVHNTPFPGGAIRGQLK
jgi:hypothetical protein